MPHARYLDPTGEKYGLPTYPWGAAWVLDDDLATRKQLAAMGLRPAGQEPAAQLMWGSRRGKGRRVRTALLYRISLSKPKLPMTRARARSLAAAMRARHTCPSCHLVFMYCIPTSLGQCPNCEYDTVPEDWELGYQDADAYFAAVDSAWLENAA
ncbi:RRQRL motif-containing zinc-binding protein [Nocardiopsis sediminis]|uniref:RRQRL motif-containing zinc-binding protein n=1 Tax=Nocardiopsis sediminis TaxID=1778267 RepID=A0ABV8FTP0_9ACTN